MTDRISLGKNVFNVFHVGHQKDGKYTPNSVVKVLASTYR